MPSWDDFSSFTVVKYYLVLQSHLLPPKWSAREKASLNDLESDPDSWKCSPNLTSSGIKDKDKDKEYLFEI